MPNSVAGLLLAAGGGSRLGRPKATVRFDGENLAQRGVRMLTDGGCGPVVVVTGAVRVKLAGTEVVHNPNWESGMASSLRLGLRALESLGSSIRAVVIALVDQPFVSSEAVRRLHEAYVSGAQIAAATYGGRRRNPVLIVRAFWADVATTATGDIGARTFMATHPDLIVDVDCDGLGDPFDIDTPADLRRLI